jgi:predicted DCC family thiol-disulfide oxidoreductase YuxK
MRSLTVLYDSTCGFCSTCRNWLSKQPQLVSLEFIPANHSEAARRFPTLAGAAPEELVVVSDEGGVYRGSHAWIMCLWALSEYREWLFRLSSPALLPLARNAYAWVAQNRMTLSRLLRLAPDREIEAALLSRRPTCQAGACDVPRETAAR